MTETRAEQQAAAAAAPCLILKQFGVVHVRKAFSETEQRQLFEMISSEIKTRPPSNPIPSNFHLSSGDIGAKQRKQPLHECGELLYNRVAAEVAKQLSPEELSSEPALARIARVHTGEQPVRVDHVSGVAYVAHSVLDNHQDGPMPLYTMSVALGDACDFVVGEKRKPPAPPVRALHACLPPSCYYPGRACAHAAPRAIASRCLRQPQGASPSKIYERASPSRSEWSRATPSFSTAEACRTGCRKSTRTARRPSFASCSRRASKAPG